MGQISTGVWVKFIPALTHQIKFITIGSENLLEHQETHIETAFGVKPYQHYGLAEGVANISENINNELVVDEDFSGIEFVNVNGQGLHLIGTSLTNFAMPLLRYDTKDIVVLSQKNTCSRFPRIVESIDGRKEDYIVLSDGRKGVELNFTYHETIKRTKGGKLRFVISDVNI